MKKITASKLDRVARCPASAVLPQVTDQGGEPASRGTALHAYLARVGAVGVDAALLEVDELYRDAARSIELVKLPVTLSTEIAFAYNWRRDTARMLTGEGREAYADVTEEEIAGRLDIGGIGRNGDEVVAYVGDYKGPYAWLPAPSASLQLGFGLVALSRAFGATSGVVEYIRLRGDGTHHRARATVDVIGIEAIAEKLHRTMTKVAELDAARAEDGRVDVAEGEWCTYCPAMHHCPAKTALLRHVVADPSPVPYAVPLTPDIAAHAYRRLQEVKRIVARAEGALYAYAKLEPVPLGLDADGSLRFFGELSRPGNEILDGAVVHAVLTERYGGEKANQVVTMEATKKAITDLVRTTAEHGALAKTVAAILDEVRKRNGTSRPPTITTTEYTIAPDGDINAKRKRTPAP